MTETVTATIELWHSDRVRERLIFELPAALTLRDIAGYLLTEQGWILQTITGEIVRAAAYREGTE